MISITYPTHYAVKITRDDGTHFFAYNGPGPCGLWKTRREAVRFKNLLHTEGRIAKKKLKVVKVEAIITETKT